MSVAWVLMSVFSVSTLWVGAFATGANWKDLTPKERRWWLLVTWGAAVLAVAATVLAATE